MLAYITDQESIFNFSIVILQGSGEIAFSNPYAVSNSYFLRNSFDSDETVNIQSLQGDGTGFLHISGQDFNITAASSPSGEPLSPTRAPVFPASLLLSSGSAYLPESIAIAGPSILSLSGTVCGLSNISVLAGGTLALGDSGFTCSGQAGGFQGNQSRSSQAGVFQFNEIGVYANGTLGNATIGESTLSGLVCVFRGAMVHDVLAEQLLDETNATSFGMMLNYCISES